MAEADHRHVTDGGALVARVLREAGVTRIFALHGGHLDAAFKGFLDEGIELVDWRMRGWTARRCCLWRARRRCARRR